MIFSSESWDSKFFKSDIGGTVGGLGEAVFYFETFDFPKIFTLTSFTSTKIHSPQVPPWSPQLQIWKVWNLSFHWKKNHKKSFLDQFLSSLEVSSIWSGIGVDENIWFWVWNNLSNTRPNIWISYQNRASGGLLGIRFEKSNISAFTGKKNYPIIFFWTEFKFVNSKTTEKRRF